jgi:hypothetical protein
VDSIARLFTSYVVHLQTVPMHAQTTQLSGAADYRTADTSATQKERIHDLRERIERPVRGIREELEGDKSLYARTAIAALLTALDNKALKVGGRNPQSFVDGLDLGQSLPLSTNMHPMDPQP